MNFFTKLTAMATMAIMVASCSTNREDLNGKSFIRVLDTGTDMFRSDIRGSRPEYITFMNDGFCEFTWRELNYSGNYRLYNDTIVIRGAYGRPAFRVAISGDTITGRGAMDGLYVESSRLLEEKGHLFKGISHSTMNMRDRPSTDGNVLATVPRNNRFEVLSPLHKKSEWMKVRYNGQEGWMFIKDNMFDPVKKK